MKLPFSPSLLMLPILALLMACHDTNDDDWGNQQDNSVNTNKNDASQEPALQRLEFPKVKGGNSIVLIHTTNDQYGINYSVEWDCEKKAQRWSAYQMNAENRGGNVGRYQDGYPFDELLDYKYYFHKHGEPYDPFWYSGFNHGHICPSADRQYSKLANRQTFFLTNMQPQYSQFNGGENSPWYRLEDKVRSWAAATTTEVLYVVKGGTIEDDQVFPTRVKGEMRVPKYFFVALLLKNAQGYKAVGFWMEHKSSYPTKESLANYALNIRDLEQKTGIDFFCNLPDNTEDHVETLPIENVRRAWGL